VDEAGRGPLAGPVVAAAVILHPERADRRAGRLEAARRGLARGAVAAHHGRASAWAIAWADAAEIDALNILAASMLAMRRAVDRLGVAPDHVCVDGNRCPRLAPGCTVEAVVRGDASVAAISAASILAKTWRDAWMERLELRHPGYGFARHKGYPTAEHRTALARLGPCRPTGAASGRSRACSKGVAMSPGFVHLRVHTEYSLADSVIRIPALLDRVAELGMPAVAVTDQVNLFAMVKFYKGALKRGIKPLVGADLWIDEPGDPRHPSRLALLCRNAGLPEPVPPADARLSRGPSPGPGAGHARLAGAAACRGLIALSAAREGDVGRALLAGRRDSASRMPRVLARALPRQLLPGAPAHRARGRRVPCGRGGRARGRHGHAGGGEQRRALPGRADFDAHEARVCIHQGHTLSDPRRPRDYSEEQYLKSAEEMAALLFRPARGAGEQRRDRPALQSRAGARQDLPAGLPGAGGRDRRQPPAGAGGRAGGAPARAAAAAGKADAAADYRPGSSASST
jgi:ribonuclease HII